MKKSSKKPAVSRDTAAKIIPIKVANVVALATLPEAHAIWHVPLIASMKVVTLIPKATEFVRLRPPHDVDEGRLLAIQAALRAVGCAFTTERAHRPSSFPIVAASPHTTAREVVRELVEQTTTQDRAALVARTEETMGKVGL